MNKIGVTSSAETSDELPQVDAIREIIFPMAFCLSLVAPHLEDLSEAREEQQSQKPLSLLLTGHLQQPHFQLSE